MLSEHGLRSRSVRTKLLLTSYQRKLNGFDLKSLKLRRRTVEVLLHMTWYQLRDTDCQRKLQRKLEGMCEDPGVTASIPRHHQIYAAIETRETYYIY